MAKYLLEDEVGFDSDLIGFPRLGGCMAVVLQTDLTLYGFHITPGNTHKSAGFAQFIAANGPQGNAMHLYGSCFWNNRYMGGNGKAQWRTEMTTIATALGYHGQATGFDTSSALSHADKTMSAMQTHIGSNYVEYRRVAARNICQIFYKKMGKMATTPTAVPLAQPIHKIVPNPAVLGAFNQLNRPNMDRADLAATATRMHEAGFFGTHTFTIP